jgi:methanogenic corrinoid protein MtbC1
MGVQLEDKLLKAMVDLEEDEVLELARRMIASGVEQTEDYLQQQADER